MQTERFEERKMFEKWDYKSTVVDKNVVISKESRGGSTSRYFLKVPQSADGKNNHSTMSDMLNYAEFLVLL